jgi:sensor histidine kinase YesM
MTTHTGNTRRYSIVAGHLFAWSLYIAFIYTANYLANPKLQLLPTILFLLPFCITFYTAVYMLDRFKAKGIWWMIASFFLVFLLMSAIGYLYVYGILPQFDIILYRSTGFADYLKSVLLGYVQYYSYALLYFYVRELIRKEKHLRKVEADRLRQQLETRDMEYAFLRAQVNPHFLHNSLNVLFAQALEYSEELAANIENLSHIMRYSLEGAAGAEPVAVERELEQLQLLIGFYKLRFDDARLIRYTSNGSASGQLVPPLSFITLVENAFKHGQIKDALHPLTIQVDFNKGGVDFRCSNQKRKGSMPVSSHQLGLNNLKRRLELSFPGRYELQIQETEQLYDARLTITS